MDRKKYLRFCRVCANKKDVQLLVPIIGNEDHCDMSHKISALYIQFNVHDRLPQEICQLCLSRVDLSYTFIEACKRAQQKLLQTSYSGFDFHATICQDKNPPDTLYQSPNIIMRQEFVISKDPCETVEAKTDLEEIKEEQYAVEDENHLEEPETHEPINKCLARQSVPESEKKHTCSLCEKRFQTQSGLKFHTESIHGKSRFVCDICGKEFVHKTYLNSHMRLHLPASVKKLFNCSTCDKRYPTKFKLKEHLNTHFDVRPYSCHVCKKSFHQSHNLRAHLLTHKEVARRVYYCSQCGDRPFYCRRLLVRHIRRHNKNSVVCRICEESLASRGELKKHSKEVHTQEEMSKRLKQRDKNIVECPTCHLPLSKFSLQRHVLSHTETTEGVTCETCGKRLKCSRTLLYHYKAYHSGQEDWFQCQYCEATFMSKLQRTRHEYKHTGETPFKCTECDKSFRSAGSLRQHGSVHSTEMNHKCPVCSKHFKRKSAVDVHMRIHTGDLPFQCRHCDKKCSQKNDRDKHERTHLKCFSCKLEFKTVDDCTAHIVKCTKEKKQDCPERILPDLSEENSFTQHSGEDVEYTSSNVESGELNTIVPSVVQYLCTACNVTFDNEQRLEVHFTRYHGQSSQDSTVESVHFEYTVQ